MANSVNDRVYFPELTSLRFFAFLLVFFHHILPQSVDFWIQQGLPLWLSEPLVDLSLVGAFGVDLFLALSSFLLTTLLLKEHEKFKRIQVGKFLIRRVLRIWPLYFLMVVFMAYGLPLFFPDQGFHKLQLSFMLFYANLAIARYGFPPSDISPLWSISLEEQFYLSWPILLYVFGVRNIPKIACLYLICAFCFRTSLYYSNAPYYEFACHSVSRADAIIWGILLAYVWNKSPIALSSAQRALAFALGCAPPLICMYFWKEGAFSGGPALVAYPLAGICSAIIVLASLNLLSPTHWWWSCRFSKILDYLGTISYGLYVFHLLVITLVQGGHRFPITLNGGISSFVLHSFAALIGTIMLAALSFQLWERPFLKLKSRFVVIKNV